MTTVAVVIMVATVVLCSFWILVRERAHDMEIKAIGVRHRAELKVERDTHRAIQSGAQRRIGILETELARIEKEIGSPVYIKMQSMSTRFLVHDFSIASLDHQSLEEALRAMAEKALHGLEERARKELVAIFTDPVVESYDDVSGKAYRVSVGVFPKFQLAPDSGEFEIQGHRVRIHLDDDGQEEERFTYVPIVFSRRRGD